MKKTIFVAGAAGAIGLPLVKLLAGRGHEVFGLTRDAGKAGILEQAGCLPVVADVYDLPGLRQALRDIEIDVLVHQLTDLPFGLTAELLPEGFLRNARIRDEGTRNLLEATGPVPRLVAQSIAFCHGNNPGPFTESDPVENDSIRRFEERLLAHPAATAVLRYGFLYGPGTGMQGTPPPGSISPETAALVAVCAIEDVATGIFHAAGPGPFDTAKARSTWPVLETPLSRLP